MPSWTVEDNCQGEYVCHKCGRSMACAVPPLVRRCSTASPPAVAKPVPPGAIELLVVGRCHICTEEKRINYCDLCGHWLCEACGNDWIARGVAALKAFLGGAKEGCCGPKWPEPVKQQKCCGQ